MAVKTAGKIKKSHLSNKKSWISLLNSAQICKKHSVTQVNFHLYHYAGNNPIKYTDPDGRITAIVMANKEFFQTETEEIKLWVAKGCPTSCNPKMKAVYKDMYEYENKIL